MWNLLGLFWYANIFCCFILDCYWLLCEDWVEWFFFSISHLWWNNYTISFENFLEILSRDASLASNHNWQTLYTYWLLRRRNESIEVITNQLMRQKDGGYLRIIIFASETIQKSSLNIKSSIHGGILTEFLSLSVFIRHVGNLSWGCWAHCEIYKSLQYQSRNR